MRRGSVLDLITHERRETRNEQRDGGGWGPVASPVFKTAWAAVRSPEGSTPFLLRHVWIIKLLR